MNEEQWVNISGVPSHYEVSSLGRFRNNLTGKILKGCTDRKGYIKIGFPATKPKLAHRIVAAAFIFTSDPRKDINHINGNKHDNRVENLEWCTRSQNIKHSYDYLGRKSTFNNLGRTGILCPTSKKVAMIDKYGNVVSNFNSAKEAARHFNSKYGGSNIATVCRGKKQFAFGYKWSYVI